MKKSKQRWTIVPIESPASSGKGKRLPKKSTKIWFDSKGTSKFHK